MLRQLFGITILLAGFGVQALAQDAPAPSSELEAVGLTPPTVLSKGYENHGDDRLSSKIVGQTVYDSAAKDAKSIGLINDLVVTPDRVVSAAILEVGDFLGVGKKSVAVDFAQLQWVKASDGQFRFVMTTTADALAAAPAFVWNDNGATATSNKHTETVASANATDQHQPETNASAESPGRSGMSDIDPSTLSPDQLNGVAVYGVDQRLGTVNSVLTNPDGSIDALIIDIGGFLGLGAKPVAVAFESFSASDDNNGNLYLLINATAPALETQTAYDPATYDSDRSAQRMRVAR